MSENTINTWLQDPRLLPSQQALLTEYDIEYKSNDLSIKTRISNLNALINFARFTSKDFKNVTKQDVIKFIDIMQQRKYTPLTRKNYLVRIKTFFKWLNGGEEFPPCVKWLKQKRALNNLGQLTWEGKILSQPEIQLLLDHAPQLDKKAMIMVCYDTGCRKGELCNMKVGSVKFVGKKVIIELTGKTGTRTIERYKCVPLLKQYFNTIPPHQRTNPQHPVWRIKPDSFTKYVRRIARNAGIKKRVYPHLLRHTRATELATSLTEAEMRYEFGWAPSSTTPSLYIHLTKSSTSKLATEAGYSIREMDAIKQKEAFKPHVCFCGEVNEHDAIFCNKCGIPLADEVKKQQKELYDLTQILVEMAEKYPPLIEAIESYKKQKSP